MHKVLLIASLIILFDVQAALAADPIGYVKTATGVTTVIRAGSTTPLKVGDAVFEDDTVKTGLESSLGVTMKDGTALSAGPETELLLDEYAYAPRKNDLGFTARLSQGTLEFVSGMLGKLAPESVSIETPTGVIGMRGTHFLVRVDPGQKFPDRPAAGRTGSKAGSPARTTYR